MWKLQNNRIKDQRSIKMPNEDLKEDFYELWDMLQLHSSILRLKDSLCLSMKKRFCRHRHLEGFVISLLIYIFPPSSSFFFFYFSLIVLVESMRDMNFDERVSSSSQFLTYRQQKNTILLNSEQHISSSNKGMKWKCFIYTHEKHEVETNQHAMRYSSE